MPELIVFVAAVPAVLLLLRLAEPVLFDRPPRRRRRPPRPAGLIGGRPGVRR